MKYKLILLLTVFGTVFVGNNALGGRPARTIVIVPPPAVVVPIVSEPR